MYSYGVWSNLFNTNHAPQIVVAKAMYLYHIRPHFELYYDNIKNIDRFCCRVIERYSILSQEHLVGNRQFQAKISPLSLK